MSRLADGFIRALRLRHQAMLDRTVADIHTMALDPQLERAAIKLVREYVEAELHAHIATCETALQLRGQRVH